LVEQAAAEHGDAGEDFVRAVRAAAEHGDAGDDFVRITRSGTWCSLGSGWENVVPGCWERFLAGQSLAVAAAAQHGLEQAEDPHKSASLEDAHKSASRKARQQRQASSKKKK
jgi:hypothetical protein